MMEVHFTPEVEKKLVELAARTGREARELVQDFVANCVGELADVRAMLNSRYDGSQKRQVATH
jgi:hypothetical protein